VIDAEKDDYPIRLMCTLLGISRSGYYAWKEREPSMRAREEENLKSEILEIHRQSRGTYGSPRIHNELNKTRPQEQTINRKRVERIMREEGLCGRNKRRTRRTTNPESERPPAPDLLARKFEVDEPDRVWVADITYIWTLQGWIYLAVIIDLFSRRVVGWSLADHMRKELVLNALKAALGHRRPSMRGLIFHSDRGSQYTSMAHRDALERAGATASMSRPGECWDNAVAESFFSTFKIEMLYRNDFKTKQEARTAIAEWIGVFYNHQRHHSTIGYATPAGFEESYYASQLAEVA